MPPRLEFSKALGRKTRTEPLNEQGILTWDLVRQAILEGKPDEAIEWLKYIKEVENMVEPKRPRIARMVQNQLAYIAQRWGEEHIEKALRWWRRKLIEAGNEPTYRMTPLERLQSHSEMERADFSGADGERFEIKEEPDRYVMVLDPCGTCGQMRRADAKGKGSKLDKTTKAYPWSWGKANVPYYCTHDCIWWEIMAIEDIGYPVRIHEWSEDPMQPCRVLFYKDPRLIPEQYFTRLGFKKDEKRFK